MKKVVLLLILFQYIFPLYAQDDLFAFDEEALIPSRQRLEMEIRTSTLPELAAWCRSLGLSENGTRADLSGRLRQYFELPQPVQNDSGGRIVTIESAQFSEYFTIDVIGEEYARLSGNVSISLKDGNIIHRVSADEVLYNRTRNIINARGNVVYVKTENNDVETFRGDNITVDLDNWTSVFIGGSSIRKIDGDNSSLLFSGSVITVSDSDVTVLSGATITNASNEEALWSISASRLWLLPDSDFAILNAVLRVGEIPVLYLPFFYLPGDQLFFHPVAGLRNREGAFVQTTTYILGQPRSDSSETNSFSRIFGNTSDDERERQGLFLVSTGRRYTDTNSLSLKAYLDYYVNLGLYAGIDLSAPRTGILNPLTFSFGLGFTRTVSMIGGNYTPYIQNDEGLFDGSFDWNHSNIFSLSVPFRYRMRINSSINIPSGRLSWNIPFYSDPYVDRDFLNRSENMDFINMLQQGFSAGQGSSSQSEIRNYQWHVNANYSPSVPSLAPYISRISISNLSTSMAFRSIADTSVTNTADPTRSFFAPDKYTIYNFSGSLSGTPLSLSSAAARTAGTANTRNQETEDYLKGIGSPISPWETESGQQNRTSVRSAANTPADPLSPPVLTQSFSLPRAGNVTFNIDYQFSPASATELQFMSNNWKSYDQVSWGDTQSVLSSISANSNLNMRFNHSTGLFSNTVTFSGNGTFRDYGYLNEEAFMNNSGQIDYGRMQEARRQQYGQTNYSSTYTYNGSIRPFMDDPVFSLTNFQYNLRGTLVRSKRYAGGDSHELTPQWGKWAKEERVDGEDILGLTNHRLTANVTANIMGFNQSVSIGATLPPLDLLIQTNATLRFWISETNINFRIERPDINGEWLFRPVYITETLRFENIGSFTYYMVIRPEENNEITNITSSVTLWNFRASFTAEKIARSVFEFPGGWKLEGEPLLLPKELSFSYRTTLTNREIIKDRMYYSFNINTSLNFNLQQYTNSNFQFTMGFNFNIPGLLELRLSATSHNKVIWRYFKGFPGMDNFTFMYPEGPQNNIFLDLLDSFNFFDEAKRRRSGFKIQRFNLTVAHFLGDWKAELGLSMYPFQSSVQGLQRFQIATDVSFLVQWRPITEIKTDIGYDGRNDRWENRQ